MREDLIDAAQGTSLSLGQDLTGVTATLADGGTQGQVTAGLLNRVRLSKVSGQEEMLNVYIGGQGTSADQAAVLADSLVGAIRSERDALSAVLSSGSIDPDISPQDYRTMGQTFQTYTDFLDRTTDEDFMSDLRTSIMDRGIAFGSISGEPYSAAIAAAETVSTNADADVLLGDRSARIIASTQQPDSLRGVLAISPFERTDLATDASGAARGAADVATESAARDTQAMTLANTLTDIMDERPGLARGIREELGALNYGTATADQARRVREMYDKFKKPAAIGLTALAAVGVGYYMYRKKKKRDEYDETMEEQEMMPAMAPRQDVYSQQLPMQAYSRIQDPLSTAGVVGNLDRNKINHTSMGPNKYDYLFS